MCSKLPSTSTSHILKKRKVNKHIAVTNNIFLKKIEIKKIEAIVALTKKKTLVSISNQTLTRIHLSLESWGLKM